MFNRFCRKFYYKVTSYTCYLYTFQITLNLIELIKSYDKINEVHSWQRAAIEYSFYFTKNSIHPFDVNSYKQNSYF